MYAHHFGLKRRPFRANATGNDVFVGPQTVTAMAGLKKSLLSNDAIAAISGPVGSGKTTLVLRALESMQVNQQVICIARMRLQSTDVLDFLLGELGVENQPSGPIQKFTAFRRRLKELQVDGTRVVIAIEDCARFGADALAELEALTAADAGVSDGAAIVLMGDESLTSLLAHADLARTRQRIRQHHTTTALCAAELRGYLRHCFRLSGSDFESLFEANAAPLLQHLSKGIPRVVNNLVEAAMTAAADQNLQQVSSELIARVAENEFGLDASGFDLTAQPVAPLKARIETAIALQPEVIPEPAKTIGAETNAEPEPLLAVSPIIEPEVNSEIASLAEAEPAFETLLEALPPVEPVALAETVAVEEEEFGFDDLPELEVEPVVAKITEPSPATIFEPMPVLASELVAEPEPEFGLEQVSTPLASTDDPFIVFADAEANTQTQAESEQAIPELIQDTLPDLEILAPELVELDEQATEPLEATIEAASEAIPDWDRDPTMAELKPDLAALEQAMAIAHGGEPEVSPADAAAIEMKPPVLPDLIPEITLDNAISRKLENNLIDEPGEVRAPTPVATATGSSEPATTPAVNLPPKRSKKADAELDKIANELARAKSLEDVDDLMAETLFGEELSLAASQFIKKPASGESANDDMESVVALGLQVPNGTGPTKAAGLQEPNDPGPTSMDFEVTLGGPSAQSEVGMDLSASQRLKTVRALNADLHPSLREPDARAANDAPTDSQESRESIEDQINISMTQTLKALNVKPPVRRSDFEDENDENETKDSFFSRFKRS